MLQHINLKDGLCPKQLGIKFLIFIPPPPHVHIIFIHSFSGQAFYYSKVYENIIGEYNFKKKKTLVHYTIVNFSNIIILFSIAPQSSYHSSNFTITKVITLNIFASFIVSVLFIGSLLLFCIASPIK